jgi:hypothetical protein
MRTEKAVPINPENNANIKYSVPISFAFEDKNHLSFHSVIDVKLVLRYSRSITFPLSNPVAISIPFPLSRPLAVSIPFALSRCVAVSICDNSLYLAGSFWAIELSG